MNQQLDQPSSSHHGVENARMQWLVWQLPNHGLYAALGWRLAMAAPFVLAAFLALLFVPRYRRWAAAGLLLCAAGATLAATVFHYSYSLVIWGGHESAIRMLDERAFVAGFGASAVVYGMGVAVIAAVRRLMRQRAA